ncbi:pseudouridine synthase [Mycena floridula]|nr:pseudouridine synthase [Mycena floridula]
MADPAESAPQKAVIVSPKTPGTAGLKKIPPYWYPYTTYAKERWLNRELLEVVSTEFRDRSMEYYRYALESGVTTINGQIAKPDTIVKNGDRIENVVHRHEPPVTATPVKVLLEDTDREFIVVDKPGSIPVHASGRYFRNTLIEILVNDFGYEKVYPVNRLDRLTSGLMILPTSADRARSLTAEFMAGTVRKVYVARCKGRFPEEEIICEQPLLTVDRQMGLNIVHPEGKPAKTIFNLIRYDANTDSSVVLCKPMTGRSHQLRVHLQFLGYPIANDPDRIYFSVIAAKITYRAQTSENQGIDIVPSDERSAPAPPEHLDVQGNSENKALRPIRNRYHSSFFRERLERILAWDRQVPLSSEAVSVITRLRNMKDKDEDWSRWRDVVFKAKGALQPPDIKLNIPNLSLKPPPPRNKKRRNKGQEMAGVSIRKTKDVALDSSASTPVETEDDPVVLDDEDMPFTTLDSTSAPLEKHTKIQKETPEATMDLEAVQQVEAPLAEEANTETEPNVDVHVEAPSQLSTAEALERAAAMEPQVDPLAGLTQHSYCPDCYLPLHPDPRPEKLYIFLHALRYTTSLGSFETEMPEWSRESWVWEIDIET